MAEPKVYKTLSNGSVVVDAKLLYQLPKVKAFIERMRVSFEAQQKLSLPKEPELIREPARTRP